MKTDFYIELNDIEKKVVRTQLDLQKLEIKTFKAKFAGVKIYMKYEFEEVKRYIHASLYLAVNTQQLMDYTKGKIINDIREFKNHKDKVLGDDNFKDLMFSLKNKQGYEENDSAAGLVFEDEAYKFQKKEVENYMERNFANHSDMLYRDIYKNIIENMDSSKNKSEDLFIGC